MVAYPMLRKTLDQSVFSWLVLVFQRLIATRWVVPDTSDRIMVKEFLEKVAFMSVLGALGLLSLWLQVGMVEEQPVVFDGDQRHDPDYYVENFTAVGMDVSGQRRYILEAERMVHYPDDDTALLDYPHIVQYMEGKAPRHTYADSGWMSSDGNEILLTDNVKVIQGRDSRGGGGIMTTDKLRILLDQDKNLEALK